MKKFWNHGFALVILTPRSIKTRPTDITTSTVISKSSL